MSNKNIPSKDDDRRVISFRRRTALPPFSQPVKDLTQYEHGREAPDDYRHRMVVNLFVFLLVAGLIGLGLWLATTMADMRKDQECVLSGRRGCAPVEIHGSRW